MKFSETTLYPFKKLLSFCNICDGENDCGNADDEDEELCTGLKNEISSDKPCPWPSRMRCSSSKVCIKSEKMCNGVQDCPGIDDSDERLPFCDKDQCESHDQIWCKTSKKKQTDTGSNEF